MDAKDIKKAKDLKNALSRFGGKQPARGAGSVRIVERPTTITNNLEPMKGVDYFTKAEVDAIKAEVVAEITGKDLITQETVREIVKVMHSLPEIDKLEVSKGIRNANSFIYKGTKYGVEEMMHGGSSSSTGIVLETNSVLNGSQVLLNLHAGTNITLTDNGSGTITIDATGGASGVTSVTGTADRITSSGGTTPSIDIAATYVGQTSITTLGTITTGTWSATTIALNKGGTGQTTKAAAFDALSPMTTGGDIIYGGVSGTGTRLANGSAGQVLTSSGTTVAPTWQTPTTGTVTSVSGTTNRITSTGGATPVIDISASYVGQASITTVGTLSAGAIPASLITAGTFGSGAYSFGTGNAVTLGTIELGAASDTTIARVSAGVISVEGVTVILANSSPTFGTITTTGNIELGNASDTTLSRSSAGVLAVEGIVIPSISSTNTLTNKRITKRVLSAAAYTTDTGSSLNGDTQDMFIVTAQTGALKFNNPSGTPTDGQTLVISVASSTTSARALTWDTAFGSTTVSLPSTTAATTATLTIGFIWSASKSLWQCVAVA